MSKKRFWSFKMPKFKVPKLNMPKFTLPRFNWKWTLGAVLVLLLVGGGIGIYISYDSVPPQEAVSKALDATLNAESYRYTAVSKKVVDGEEQILSEVNGEKCKDSVHFNGRLHVVNSDFEIYQVNNKFYRKDVFSQDWLVVEEANEEATEKLIQEIDPLGSFAFAGPIDVQYIGKEKVNDKKCKKYEVMAQTENKYLATLWKNFVYSIWVDKSNKLVKAEVSAVNKQHENHQLIMTIEFFDYNQEIVIEPPVQ